jgi:2-C-methyl-D-erythritol 2,4-cyclodiphosphate synthase
VTLGIRVGTGYDVHRFVDGRPLFLGGVAIPHDRGLEGHSDADALLHAIMDSLLGAAGLDDIGHQFPPADERFRDASSLKLLASVWDLVGHAGWQVVNVDSTVIAERPKIASFLPSMKKAIGDALGISEREIGIKATTNEGLGFVGRGEGIAAIAVALLVRREQQDLEG